MGVVGSDLVDEAVADQLHLEGRLEEGEREEEGAVAGLFGVDEEVEFYGFGGALGDGGEVAVLYDVEGDGAVVDGLLIHLPHHLLRSCRGSHHHQHVLAAPPDRRQRALELKNID